MLTYKFDYLTKEFLYSQEAFLDPLESLRLGKEVYLLPPDSTFTKPLKQKDGYAVVWDGTVWGYVPDHRRKRDEHGFIEGSGTPYWLSRDTWETPARYMTELGDLPDGALLKQPEKPFSEYQQEKFAELAAKTSEAEKGAYLTSSVGGIVIDANERANTDIEGLIKLLKAAPEGTTAEFCCYDNSSYIVSLADLEIMQLEVIMNGQGIYKQKWAYRDAIKAATTKEELDAIKIVYVYSDFSK